MKTEKRNENRSKISHEFQINEIKASAKNPNDLN